MAVPSPAIPSFTDGTIVHQADLNALAQNITNLFTFNQASFLTQRPCVIAQQTTGQTFASSTDTLINFNSALVNTDNMWVASVASQLTVQHGGIYLVFAQIHWPGNVDTTVSPAWTSMDILVNGSSPVSNGISHTTIPTITSSTSPTPGGGTASAVIANLAAGATVYLNGNHNYGPSITLATSRGGSFLGAIYLTPST